MKCEYGFCIVCEKEIAVPCGHCCSRRPGPEYTEIELDWSNGSRMKTAVCISCAKDKVWEADKLALTQAIWEAWDKMKATYSKDVVLV